MSRQRVEDFLTKQLFISKNIVTYRLLSRELGIHVNVAKNELAAFYTNANKSPDRACSATYLISGEYGSPSPYNAGDADTKSESKDVNGGLLNMDIDLDPSPYDFTPTQSQSQSQSQLKPQARDFRLAEQSGKDNGDVVVQIRLTVVGEAGLEDAKAKYMKVNSVTLYSLSPAPIRDADLLCEPSRRVREIDNQKGVELAKAVGRIIGQGIEMKAGITKPKGRPAATTTTSARPIPAAPKLKSGASTSTSATTTTASTKAEEKGKEPAKDEPKLKPKTGKTNFFALKSQPQAKEKETKGSTESKSKAFFSAASDSSSKSTAAPWAKEQAAVPAPAPPPPPKEEKSKEVEPVKRGTKRKSNIAIPSDEEESAKSTSATPSGAPSRQSSNPPSTRSSPQPTRAMSKLRLQKNVIVSDEEEDEGLPRKKITKKPRRKVTHMSDDEDEHDSDAAKESTRALKSMMDIDDDQVEKASSKPKVKSLRREEEEETEPEQEAPKAVDQDGDVNMSDDTEAKPKPKPRKKKEKRAVPMGRNGLKKRRMMKSRTRFDEKGYMVTEDYSSYESVEEEEEEEEEPKKTISTKKGGGGKRAAGIRKKEDSMTESAPPEDTAVINPTTNSEIKSKTTAKAATSSTKATTSKTTGTKGGQKQKTLNTFFGAPKAKK